MTRTLKEILSLAVYPKYTICIRNAPWEREKDNEFHLIDEALKLNYIEFNYKERDNINGGIIYVYKLTSEGFAFLKE